MANRYLTQFFYTFFKKPSLIAGSIPLSSAAAVGTVNAPGIASVVKTGTGLYEITLQDKWPSLFNLSATVLDSAQDLVVDFTTDLTSSSKTIVMRTKVAGTAANVTDACVVYVSFLFNNSSV